MSCLGGFVSRLMRRRAFVMPVEWERERRGIQRSEGRGMRDGCLTMQRVCVMVSFFFFFIFLVCLREHWRLILCLFVFCSTSCEVYGRGDQQFQFGIDEITAYLFCVSRGIVPQQWSVRDFVSERDDSFNRRKELRW